MIHNLDVALQRFAACGIPVHDISSRDICDGYRGKTLALIWRIISFSDLTRVLSLDRLIKEIERVKRVNFARGLLSLTPSTDNVRYHNYIPIILWW